MTTFSHANLPAAGWKRYMKKVATEMVRIDGPFEVVTREGVLSCEDGFLAIDSLGWPYPIAKDEHDRIYIELGEPK